MKIEDAIQQATFRDNASKASINILYTASWLSVNLTRILKPFGISWQQFNILRILKGQQGKPAPLRLVTERMIDQMSNTSRMVDKLVQKGYIIRHECPKDRRQVDLLLTEKGLREVENASLRVQHETQKYFDHLSEDQLHQLNSMLDIIRS